MKRQFYKFCLTIFFLRTKHILTRTATFYFFFYLFFFCVTKHTHTHTHKLTHKTSHTKKKTMHLDSGSIKSNPSEKIKCVAALYQDCWHLVFAVIFFIFFTFFSFLWPHTQQINEKNNATKKEKTVVIQYCQNTPKSENEGHFLLYIWFAQYHMIHLKFFLCFFLQWVNQTTKTQKNKKLVSTYRQFPKRLVLARFSHCII